MYAKSHYTKYGSRLHDCKSYYNNYQGFARQSTSSAHFLTITSFS